MDIKWVAIMIIGTVVAMSASLAVNDYGKHKCISDFATSSRSAEEIKTICQ